MYIQPCIFKLCDRNKVLFYSILFYSKNGTALTKENTIKYLGAILGNNGSATHVAHRIKAASGSFVQLQAAGMHGGGLSPDALRHIRSLFNLL